ncbi:hypothetical protein [Catenulispora pinisilvae]
MGSTAIPGCPAKPPIVDVGMVAPDGRRARGSRQPGTTYME